ncbi:MAG: sugar system component [Pseudonocardiales bacterium]|uniref:PTS sugar transporter subunit IIA n=1 Tax=Pseudonocardia sp. TaxID=60912 RepID=UPI002604BAE3|nr:glucose PTS transporter subunit IIA [Pseudonocardia sp.]MCW2720434.1 phosphotransferase system enzyme component [Pseudonocardia sp.]MDT7617024.1 sugar system component [Pseudonocardiales bacterium]MDT7705158.1 sugar system component [Pseudonocardiales bacterium]
MIVGSPFAGTVQPLSAVPDPVFAEQMVGAGVAVEPPEAGPVEVGSPVDGTLVKLHPHAFVVLTASGTGVLVHLGIDTVHLAGEGFTLHAAEGAAVAAGDPVVTFDPALVRSRELSAICPVVVMDSAPDSVTGPAAGSPIGAGEALFTWT